MTGVPCHRHAVACHHSHTAQPAYSPSLLPPCPPAWQRQLSNNILQSENNKNSNRATELEHYAMIEGLQSRNLGRGVGKMIDLIQFVDNIRDQTGLYNIQWLGRIRPNLSGLEMFVSSLPPSLTVWYCRLWGPRPAGPRPPDERPLQPGGRRPETGVGQLGLAALQPPGALPLLPHHLGRRGRHAGRPSAHQCFQGKSAGSVGSSIFTVLTLVFRWEPWEASLVLASLIIISMEERGNTNAKCVHR